MNSLYLAPVAWVDGRHFWTLGRVAITYRRRRAARV